MSAFIVNKRHIDYLLSAGLRPYRASGPMRWMVPGPVDPEAWQKGSPWGPKMIEEAERRRRELTRETADRVGCMLAAENRRSVDHRYDEEEIEDLYEFAPVPDTDPVQTLKAIACYRYQSCEHPEWEQSEAYAFCDALEHRMIAMLPGYDDADWEIKPEARKVGGR